VRREHRPARNVAANGNACDTIDIGGLDPELSRAFDPERGAEQRSAGEGLACAHRGSDVGP